MRLTQTEAMELAICVAQYFYYALNTPIMTDEGYDSLESSYKKLKIRTGVLGPVPILDRVGCGDNLNEWLEKWKELSNAPQEKSA